MKKKDRTGTQATKLLVSTYDISYIRCVSRKFHDVVQNNVKEMYKKSVLQVQSFFFLLIRPFDLFLPFSLPTPFSITRLHFYVWINYKCIKRLVAILKILSATGTIWRTDYCLALHLITLSNIWWQLTNIALQYGDARWFIGPYLSQFSSKRLSHFSYLDC